MPERRAYGAPELWDALRVLDTLISAVVASPRAVFDPRSHRRAVLLLLTAKAFKTHRSILLLCQAGHGEDAMLITRSLFELVITAQYLVQKDSRQRVARYWAYHQLARKQLMDPKWADADFTAGYKGVSRRTLDAAASRAKKRFGYTRPSSAFGWAGVSLQQAAQSVGQGPAYDSFYRLSSQFEHSMLWALTTYLRDGNANASASPRWVNQTLATTFTEMRILLEVVARALNLGLLREVRTVARLGPSVRDAGSKRAG